MKRLALLAGVLMLALLLAGCQSDDDDDNGNGGTLIAFSVLQTGQTSGIGMERLTVIRNQEAYDALWLEHETAFVITPAQPTVDFAQRKVVAVFLGQRTTDRHRIEIIEIRERAANFMVKVRATLPDDECTVIDELVEPYQLVTIPRSDKVVGFTTEIVRGCP